MATISMYQDREKTFQEEIKRLTARLAREEDANLGQRNDSVEQSIH